MLAPVLETNHRKSSRQRLASNFDNPDAALTSVPINPASHKELRWLRAPPDRLAAAIPQGGILVSGLRKSLVFSGNPPLSNERNYPQALKSGTFLLSAKLFFSPGFLPVESEVPGRFQAAFRPASLQIEIG